MWKTIAIVLMVAGMAGAQATRPAGESAGKPIQNPKQIMDTIPAKERPRAPDDWNKSTLKFIAEKITAATTGKWMRIEAELIEYNADSKTAKFESRSFPWGGVDVEFEYELKWNESKASDFRDKPRGTKMRIEATATKFQIYPREEQKKKTKRGVDGSSEEYYVSEPHIVVIVTATPSPDMKIEKR